MHSELIVAFGNPVYDYIDTPFIKSEGRVLSGCSTNACLVLRQLGYSTALVGSIGLDFYDRFCAESRWYGIDIYVEPGSQTGGFSLVYDDVGNRTLDILGIADHIQHVPDICSEAAAIIIGPILQETTLDLVKQVYSMSKAPLFLDPQGLLRRVSETRRVEHFFPDDFEQVARLCHVIKANEVEAHVLTGVDPRRDAITAVRRLKSMGCAIAIVTIAEAGSLIDDGTRIYEIPAYSTRANDPTGAGDTYMAGFIHSYFRNSQDLYIAGCYGSAVSSIWIEHSGPNVHVSIDEVERRVASLLYSKKGGNL
ncbi:PfkB family carbohydrate kinase [Roseiflexus castenholzii]|uniref:PfkB domain protein n=1 Tax=Roseiflexus castenholzii (strain DSM 13941 / HLO8) TaxID=383372 RepID=A7NGA2_ROSCS|nr:PfkB family carbohydrate kinase [Roseiflexus castenholzii]ABU56489.1 PfkB domain protein [Roseiflexus castenholzii DSM 13941]